MSSDAARPFALQMVFGLNAVGLAVWFPRIPDVKAALDLDILTLSICLFGLPAGTMLGFLSVARVIDRIGLRSACIWAGALFLISFIGPALATNAVLLGLALFASGLTIATIEVSMNAKVSEIEARSGRRIMTRCHAFWSFGSVTGALIGGAFAEAGVSFLIQQLVLQPVFAVASILFARALPADDPSADPAPRQAFVRPTGALLALCAVPVGALLSEGAMMEWSALLLREHVGATPFATAAIFAVFAGTMGLARLYGDVLAERFGATVVIRASSVAMGASMVVFALSPSVWVAAPAALVLGLGCANVYPLAVSMAGRMDGVPERNITTLALIAFTAFLIGPPAIGGLAHFFGLPVALALLAPLAVLPFVGLPHARAAGSGRAPVSAP